MNDHSVVEWFEKEYDNLRKDLQNALNIIMNERNYTEQELLNANLFYTQHKEKFTKILEELYNKLAQEPIIINGKWEDTGKPYSNNVGESKTIAERAVFYIKDFVGKRKFVFKIERQHAPRSRYGFEHESQIKVVSTEYDIEKY